MTTFNAFVATAKKSTKSTKSGKYIDRLSAAELARIDAFATWLEANDFGLQSIASYRTYIATAMCAAKDDIAFDSLSSSVRSAVKKFAQSDC